MASDTDAAPEAQTQPRNIFLILVPKNAKAKNHLRQLQQRKYDGRLRPSYGKYIDRVSRDLLHDIPGGQAITGIRMVRKFHLHRTPLLLTHP